MSNESNAQLAEVHVKGLIDDTCFSSFQEFILALPQYLQVLIPSTVTNVSVSNIQPLDTQRDYVWFRRSNGGVFIGIYVYSEGGWIQVFPVPGSVTRVAGGDSRNPPDGYISAEDANLPSDQINHLMASWLLDPTNTFYVIYDVVPAST